MAPLAGSFPPPASSSQAARLKANELHPNLMASTAVPDIRSASYAYHANSSNWNPVSRQDSELQSQSSGAVGKECFCNPLFDDRFVCWIQAYVLY
jgi:hypothetical protein